MSSFDGGFEPAQQRAIATKRIAIAIRHPPLRLDCKEGITGTGRGKSPGFITRPHLGQETAEKET
jgi:hypothetical protein